MSETLGQQLKTARQEKKLSLEQASEATRIRWHYLQALEADDYSAIPSAAQARGFLRNYAAFLGIDLASALSAIQAAPPAEPEDMSGPLPQVEIAPPSPEPVTTPRPLETPGRPLAARLRSALASRRPSKPPEAREERGDAAGEGIEPEPAASEALSPQPGGGRLSDFLARFRHTDEPREQPEPSVVDETPKEELPPAPEEPEVQPGLAAAVTGESAEQIFREIGTELRKRRELLSLTPDEVERHIHVRVVFIRALEAGEFAQLPSAVQTRGMLANYAAFLDLDSDALLLRFADAIQASHRLRHPEPPGRARKSTASVRPSMPPLRSFVAGDVIFGVAVVVMVVALVVWGLGRVFAVQAKPVFLPTAPSISDVLAGTSMPTPVQEVTLISVIDTPVAPVEETATPGEATLEPTAEVNANVAVALTIVATERTFMRVTVDGKEAFNGRVLPGTAYTYEAAASIQVLTGNGAALRVTYNGRDMGLLGDFGKVAEFVYTASAVVTPIPAASPTGTATLPISPTPSTTPTATPTATRTSTPPVP